MYPPTASIFHLRLLLLGAFTSPFFYHGMASGLIYLEYFENFLTLSFLCSTIH